MRVRFVFLISPLALGAESLVVIRASPGIPLQPFAAPDDRWASALLNEQFEDAGDLMSGEGSDDRANRARRTNDERGGPRGSQSDAVGLPRIGDKVVYRERRTWEDVLVSCALTREKMDGSLGPLSV
jgi:hypothetical protein